MVEPVSTTIAVIALVGAAIASIERIVSRIKKSKCLGSEVIFGGNTPPSQATPPQVPPVPAIVEPAAIIKPVV
jgi:hypothetical protein